MPFVIVDLQIHLIYNICCRKCIHEVQRSTEMRIRVKIYFLHADLCLRIACPKSAMRRKQRRNGD